MRLERVTFRPSWAKLLARVDSIDAERCPVCGERLRPVGAITDPNEARVHLDHLDRLEASHARDPPQLSLALPT